MENVVSRDKLRKSNRRRFNVTNNYKISDRSSGSMEPAYWRGDILFLYLGNEPFRVGDVVVYKLPGKDIPIVHRTFSY
jgi:signal peptidase I